MPYEMTSDLPESVRENLPKHAQEMYRSTFNGAWEEYQHDEERAHILPDGSLAASAAHIFLDPSRNVPSVGAGGAIAAVHDTLILNNEKALCGSGQ